LAVLNVLRLVQNNGIEPQLSIALGIAPDQGVARYHHVLLRNPLKIGMPLRPMQREDLKSGGELPCLRNPVEHQAGGTHDQHRLDRRLLSAHPLPESQRLHCFTQPHFIGQDPSETMLSEKS
jgi:hypothetical protein